MVEKITDNEPEKVRKVETIFIPPPVKETNGIGIAGFVISILAIFLACIPFVGGVLWLLGLIFSIVGLTRSPKGLAIAGLVISLLGLILLILSIAGVVGLYSLSQFS